MTVGNEKRMHILHWSSWQHTMRFKSHYLVLVEGTEANVKLTRLAFAAPFRGAVYIRVLQHGYFGGAAISPSRRRGRDAAPFRGP